MGKIIYIVTMYKFGLRNEHSYVLGAYSCIQRAKSFAKKEFDYRGGKYNYEILEVQINKWYPEQHWKGVVELDILLRIYE